MPSLHPTTKYCPRCKATHPVSAFYKDRRRSDGLQGYCRACKAEHGRVWHRENREKDRERQRAYHHRNREKELERSRAYKQTEAFKESQARHYAAHPDKRKAGQAVYRAIRDGRLMKQPCEVCGEANAHAHHDSYALEDWLNVRWLCRKHHMEHHRQERERRA